MKGTEKAYAAGLIDGEGCIHAVDAKRSHHCALIVSVTNTDLDMLFWLQERWGGHVKLHGPASHKRNCKTTWQWAITSKAAEKLLRDIYPYLRTKRLRAELGFRLRALIGKRGDFDPARYEAQQDVKVALAGLNRRGV